MFSHSPRAPRRHALSTTCLIALPTALAFASPAAAQTIIGSDQNSTVNLASYGANAVAIATGVSITSSGQTAVFGAALASLTNAGQITDNSGSGIDLAAGGSVGNSGNVNAADYGVRVNNGAGALQNTGNIAAGYDGVSLNKGGTVSNSGSIFGAHMGVYTGNGAGDVSNSGVISARSGDAVSLYSGGSLTNTATGQLLGGYSGVYAGGNGAQITNAGLISGPDFGAYLMGAASVSNTGSIIGGTDGIMGFGNGAMIDNAGLIHGGQIGVKLGTDASVDNSGIISGGTFGAKLGVNSTLTNEVSGHIAGGMAAVAAASGDVLTNAGSISGGIVASGAISLDNTGVISAATPGGNAISLSNGASSITLDTGSDIEGNIASGNTASQISLAGSGTLSSNLTGFGMGSAVTVEQGAVWTGEGSWQVAELVNNGVFTPGVDGAPLTLTGDFDQSATGTLRVLVTPAGISSFAIDGAANLDGTLHYVLAPGTYEPGSDNFLTATKGISGNFAAVTTSQTGLTTTPTQHGEAAVLVVTTTGTQVATPATTATTTNNVPAALASAVTTQTATAALVIAAPTTVAPSGAPLFADTTQAMATSAFSSGQALLDHAAGTTPTACQALPAIGTSKSSNMAELAASGMCAAGGWMQVTGDTGSASGAYSLNGEGFLAGIDHDDFIGGRIGAAVGFDTDNMREKDAGTAKLQTLRIGIYAAQPVGVFLLSADVMDAFVSRDTTRETGADAATAQGRANVISGDAQIALPITWGDSAITPAFGLKIASVNAGRLNEASATQAFAVNAAAASGTTVAPYLRMTVAKRFVTASNVVITPDASLGVAANLNNPGASTRLTTQDGTVFISRAEHMAPISGQFSTGVSVSRGAWSFSARYTGEAGGNWSGQSLQAGVQVKF